MRNLIARRHRLARSFVLTGLLGLCGASMAATVVLRDGTVIRGDVKSLQDGVYTIETGSVGTLRVPKEQVRSIDESDKSATASGVAPDVNAFAPSQGALDAAKSRITQDPNLLAAVLALQNDPDMLAVLADPDIMKAIAAGDFAALMNNPKIVALMHNAKVQAIVGETQ
jgi:hypothetical protein